MNLNTEAKLARRCSVIADALGSLLFSTGGTDTFQKMRLFQQDTQTLNGTPKKMLVSLPSLEEPRSPQGVIKKKQAGG